MAFIIPTTQTTIARYAAGLYGAKLGNPTLTAVLNDVQLSTANGVNGLNAVLNKYYAPFAGKTSAEVAAIVVANAGIKAGDFGLTAAHVATAVAVVTAELNAAAPAGTQGAAIAAVLANWSNAFPSDAVYGAAATAWNLKIAQANAYSVNGQQDLPFGSVNTEFMLTAGNDNLTGTAGDDTFTANFNGEANTLQSGDKINGGAGTDTLKAIMDSGVFAVTPTITGVENIAITAQNDALRDGGQNNVSGEDAVMLDFGRVSGVKQIWSLDSRADVQVEDVRILDNEITKDVTIAFRDSDPGAVDFAVYFDQNSLRNVSSSTSLINLRVLDTYAVSQGLAPLKDSPYGSFTFTYTLNGGAATVATLASPEIQAAQTFAELVTALQAAADGIFGAGTVTVTTGSTYTVPDSVSNTLVQGTEIVLSASGNITFDTTPAGSGWLATETVPAISGLYTSFNTNVQSSTALVTSTIVLDNVGRGSNGGDLIVGGLSNGETSSSNGVQRFDITVEDNSKLSNILSTNNTLREVYIVNGTTDEKSDAYTTTVANAGNLSVGIDNDQNSKLESGAGGEDDATGAYEDSAFGFNDVRIIDGSAMTGKLAFTAAINQTSLAKYLNRTDTANDPAADNVAFVYSGGANNDTMSVTIDGAVAANSTLSAREDFNFTLNGGAGNDTVNVTLQGTGDWYVQQGAFNNVTVNGGAGNDTINTLSNGDFVINAGEGNDTVVVGNNGNKSTWVVSTQTAAGSADYLGVIANATPTFLSDGKLTVIYSGPAIAGGSGGVMGASATGTISDTGTTAFTNGLEVTVDIPTGANFAVTQFHINQAIKAAINSNAVLSKLLTATDGPGTSLIITSKVDGAHVGSDLTFTVSNSKTYVAGDTQVLNAYKLFTNNSAAVIGDVNTAISTNVDNINLRDGMINDATVNSTEVATVTVVDGLAAGQTITINGLTLTGVGAGAIAANVEIALQTSNTMVGVDVTGAYTADWVVSDGGAGTVVYTSATTGIVPNLTIGGTDATPNTLVTVNPVNEFQAGANSTLTTDNVIDLGAGNDVLVLSTSVNANEIVKFTAASGINATVVNFTAAAFDNTSGGDRLDFTSYLASKTWTGASSSAESQVRIVTTLNGDATVEANSVTVLTGFNFNTTTTDTFAGLNATNFAAAIASTNAGTANYAAITNGTLNAKNDYTTAGTTGLVSNLGKAIVMVQNDDNLGEYKVFELTFKGQATTNADANFDTVTLVGTVDFGASLTGLLAANNLVGAAVV